MESKNVHAPVPTLISVRKLRMATPSMWYQNFSWGKGKVPRLIVGDSRVAVAPVVLSEASV